MYVCRPNSKQTRRLVPLSRRLNVCVCIIPYIKKAYIHTYIAYVFCRYFSTFVWVRGDFNALHVVWTQLLGYEVKNFQGDVYIVNAGSSSVGSFLRFGFIWAEAEIFFGNKKYVVFYDRGINHTLVSAKYDKVSKVYGFKNPMVAALRYLFRNLLY